MFKLLFLCLSFGVVVYSHNFIRRDGPERSMDDYINALRSLADVGAQNHHKHSRQPTNGNSIRETIYETVRRKDNRGNINLPRYVVAEITQHNLRPRERITPQIYDHLELMDREVNDHAGHIIASSFGGPTIEGNFVPMAPNVNSNHGLWYQFEGKIRDHVKTNYRQGKVSMEAIILYSDYYQQQLGSYRPIGFCLRYRLFDNHQQILNMEPEKQCFVNDNGLGRYQNTNFEFSDFYTPQ